MAIIILGVLGVAVFWRDIRDSFTNKQETISPKDGKDKKKEKKGKKDKKKKKDDKAKGNDIPYQNSTIYYVCLPSA